MKKKMIPIAIVLIIGVLLLGAGFQRFFGRNKMVLNAVDFNGIERIPLIPEENQLMAVVETKEEAEEIARLYHITLVSYEAKVATYDTKEDPAGIIQLGKEKGYPPLSINYRYSLLEE